MRLFLLLNKPLSDFVFEIFIFIKVILFKFLDELKIFSIFVIWEISAFSKYTLINSQLVNTSSRELTLGILIFFKYKFYK